MKTQTSEDYNPIKIVLNFPGQDTRLTGVCSAYVALILCHVALGTATVVGPPRVVAKVRAG